MLDKTNKHWSCSKKVKVKVCFDIAQYQVRWTAQSALHFLDTKNGL